MTQAVCEWVWDRHLRFKNSVTVAIVILSLETAGTDL